MQSEESEGESTERKDCITNPSASTTWTENGFNLKREIRSTLHKSLRGVSTTVQKGHKSKF